MLISAEPAQGVEIYNKNGNQLSLNFSLKARRYFSHDDNISGDHSKVKITLKGETRPSPTVAGYGKLEYNVKADSPEGTAGRSAARIAYAGIRLGEYNQIDYGRNYGIMDDIGRWTGSPPPVFGGDSYSQVDNFMTYRTNNVLTWHSKNLSGLMKGLNFGVQFQGRNDGRDSHDDKGYPNASRRKLSRQNGDGIGAALSYKWANGLSIGAALARSKRTGQQRQDGLGSDATGWNTGIRYRFHRVYLAALYAEVKNMHFIGNQSQFAPKARAFETVLQYKFDCGLTPQISYQRGRAIGVSAPFSGQRDYANYFTFAAVYDLNKQIHLTLEYKKNLLRASPFTRANRISSDDVMVTMLSYQF